MAIFGFVTTITMVNLLIAMLSQTYMEIQQQMVTAFTIRKASIVMEWTEAVPIRPPFNLLALLCNALVRLACIILRSARCLRAMRKVESFRENYRESFREAWKTSGESVRALAVITSEAFKALDLARLSEPEANECSACSRRKRRKCAHSRRSSIV